MNKKTVGGIAIAIIILIGLFVFAGTHKYEDSLLRKEGVRVKINEYALMVDTCDEGSDLATCTKTVEVNGEKQKLVFEYIDFNKEGYPSTLVASINGKEFLRTTNIDLASPMTQDYQFFLNFYVIDDLIIFTYTDGADGLHTTLYAIDKDGNIILKDYNIDKNDMIIKDYVEFLTKENNEITIYATRIKEDSTYKNANICEAKSKDIVEAYYTYTFKGNSYTKKQTKKITAADYIKDNKIECKG